MLPQSKAFETAPYLKKHNPALAFFRVRRPKRNIVAIWKCEDVVQIKSVFPSRSCSHC
jgi:hypothetical protein